MIRQGIYFFFISANTKVLLSFVLSHFKSVQSKLPDIPKTTYHEWKEQMNVLDKLEK